MACGLFRTTYMNTSRNKKYYIYDIGSRRPLSGVMYVCIKFSTADNTNGMSESIVFINGLMRLVEEANLIRIDPVNNL